MKCIHLRCNLFLLKHLFPTGFLFTCFHRGLFIFGVRDDAQRAKGWSPVLLCVGDMPWSQVTPAAVGHMGTPFLCLGVWCCWVKPPPWLCIPQDGCPLLGRLQPRPPPGRVASIPDVLGEELYLISDFYSLAMAAHQYKTCCSSGEKGWFIWHW